MSAPIPPPPPMNSLKLGAPALGNCKFLREKKRMKNATEKKYVNLNKNQCACSWPPTGKSSNAVDPRSALLQSIQKGAKLKKATTVDKSGPLLAGRITNSNSSNNSISNSTNSNAPSRPTVPMTNNAQQSGMPKLGGIFEGMTSMPKLKPVGARSMVFFVLVGISLYFMWYKRGFLIFCVDNSRSPPSESPSSVSSVGSPQNTSISSSTGSVIGDFSAELAKTLTLKKQKKQQQESNSNSVSESVTRNNRGPPPQPPVKNPNTTVTDNNVKSVAAQSSPILAKQSNR